MKTILENWDRKEIWRVAVEIHGRSGVPVVAFSIVLNDVKKAYIGLYSDQTEIPKKNA